MSVNEVFPPQVAQPEQVVPGSASTPAAWRFVRLTDTPIQILAIYLSIMLVLPALLLIIDADLWPIFYRYEDFSVIEGTVVIGAVVMACIMRHFQWAREREVAVRQQPIFIYSTQRLRIAGLLLAIVVSIINVGNSGFRYDEISMSERGSLSLYAYAIIPACVKLLLIFHAFIYRGSSAMDRLERALVTAALAVSINGTGTAIVAVFSLLVLQTSACDYLFKSKVAATSLLGLVALGAAVLGIVLVVLVGAYIYGESVKRGDALTSVFDSVTGRSFGEGWTPEVLMNGLSPHYASLVNTLPMTFDFDRDSFDNLFRVWNTFLFRLQTLDIFNFGIDRGSTLQIMRLNYELIDLLALNPREGTAPGLIPGFIYCFPPILNVLMLGAFVFLLLGILQRLCLCMNEEMSIAGKFILTFLTLSLFSSPIDFLTIIDDATAFFVGLWWMSKLVEVRVASQQPTFSTAWGPEPDAK